MKESAMFVFLYNIVITIYDFSVVVYLNNLSHSFGGLELAGRFSQDHKRFRLITRGDHAPPIMT